MSPRPHRLGILGSGQLGQLLASASRSTFSNVLVYHVSAQSSETLDWADKTFTSAEWNNPEKLEAMAKVCDVWALENEFIDPDLLQSLVSQYSLKIFPDLSSYRIMRDKILEKQAAQKAGLECVAYAPVQSLDDIQNFLSEKTSGEGILKLAQGGYDGYGNLAVSLESLKSIEMQKKCTEFFHKGLCLIEEKIPFLMEVAIMAARDSSQVISFPVAETVQENHICHYVLVPARLPENVLNTIQKWAKQLLTHLNAQGLFGLEFFVTQDYRILYNEAAPRPHNSGHYSIDGCNHSQFTILRDLLLNRPLQTPSLLTPVVGMLNLLGTQNGTANLQPRALFETDPAGALCLYQKKQSRVGRKMGHYNLKGHRSEIVLEQLTKLKQRYSL
jgi:5-(carboxyamino)imidazole ribonucleotide synthase